MLLRPLGGRSCRVTFTEPSRPTAPCNVGTATRAFGTASATDGIGCPVRRTIPPAFMTERSSSNTNRVTCNVPSSMRGLVSFQDDDSKLLKVHVSRPRRVSPRYTHQPLSPSKRTSTTSPIRSLATSARLTERSYILFTRLWPCARICAAASGKTRTPMCVLPSLFGPLRTGQRPTGFLMISARRQPERSTKTQGLLSSCTDPVREIGDARGEEMVHTAEDAVR